MFVPCDLVQKIIPSTITKDQEKAHDIEKGGSLQKNLVTTAVPQGQGCWDSQIQLFEIWIKATKKHKENQKLLLSANHNKWLNNTKCQLALEAQWMARQKVRF